MLSTEKLLCPHCGSSRTMSRGKLQAECMDCRDAERVPSFFRKDLQPKHDGSVMTWMQNAVHVIHVTSKRLNQGDIYRLYGIDPDLWEIEKFTVKAPKGYRKDHKVDLVYKKGRIERGSIKDSGKMLVVDLFTYEVVFRKRVVVDITRQIVNGLIDNLSKHAPKLPKIKYSPGPKNAMYELDFPDIHMGLLSWAEESGQDYDIKLCRTIVDLALDQLLGYAKLFSVGKVLIPIGNDFFNVEDAREQTAHGTPQQEDTRAGKTFRAGFDLLRSMIEKSLSIAPVDIVIVPGNHDEQRIFMMGELIKAYFRREAVSVDNDARKRKYYPWGVNLIGFTHGYWEPVAKLPAIMAIETRDTHWGQTKYSEWHLGDKHHYKELEFVADEGQGMMIRYLRSLSANSTWTFDKGFVGSLRAASSFVWDKERGMIGAFNAAPSLA